MEIRSVYNIMLPLKNSSKNKFFFYMNLILLKSAFKPIKISVKKKTLIKMSIVRGYKGPKSSFLKYSYVVYTISFYASFYFFTRKTPLKLFFVLFSLLTLNKVVYKRKKLLII